MTNDLSQALDTYDAQRAQMQAYLEALAGLAFGDEGKVAMLVSKPAPGVHEPKDSVTVVPGFGFAGDHERKSWYRGCVVPGREVSAVSLEVLEVLGVDPLVVGDNLVTQGLDLMALQPGTRLQAGEVVLVRSEVPHRPCLLFKERTSPAIFSVAALGHRGALFVVEQGGRLEVGTPLRIVASP